MPHVKKRNEVEEEETKLRIMFILMHTEKPITLTTISKKIEQPANLVYFHLKKLKNDYLVLETTDKKYYCQPVLKDEDTTEDIEALMILIIKNIAKGIIIDKPTEKRLAKAVMENLKTYMQIFEIEVK